MPHGRNIAITHDAPNLFMLFQIAVRAAQRPHVRRTPPALYRMLPFLPAVQQAESRSIEGIATPDD